MQKLAPEIKEEISRALQELGLDFDLEGFMYTFSRIEKYCEMGFFEDMESFLCDCLEQRSIFLTHGILFMLYYSLGYREKSRFHYDEVRKYFPQDDLWENWLKGAIWNESENSPQGN